jgi:Ca2+/H+ antiporter
LLGGGVLSSLLYAATDVLAGLQYDGYSFKSQAVSELSASGAPTRPLIAGLFTTYNALMMAFGIGVWMASRRRRVGRLTGALLIASAVVGEVTTLFFPMDRRGAEETLRGSLHPPLTAVMSLLIVLAMIFGATLKGRRFRSYSIGTVLTLLVFGALAGRDAPRLEAQ